MDFIEEHRSHILFLPGIFVEDCQETDIDNEENLELNKLKLMQPENIDLLEEDNTSHVSQTSELNDEDELFSKNTAEFDVLEKSRGLELGELLEGFPNKSHNQFKKNFNDIQVYDPVPKYFINTKSWIKSTNLLCCFCHDNIRGVPYPIALGQCKTLIPENEESRENFISLITPDKLNDQNPDKASDDHLLFSCQTMKEVKAYSLHNILCCDVVCVGNYIRKISDSKITNKRESLQMSISIYGEISGETIDDVPEKELWTVMKQYCGNTGQTRNEYREKNLNKEIKLKQAMKINY